MPFRLKWKADNPSLNCTLQYGSAAATVTAMGRSKLCSCPLGGWLAESSSIIFSNRLFSKSREWEKQATEQSGGNSQVEGYGQETGKKQEREFEQILSVMQYLSWAVLPFSFMLPLAESGRKNRTRVVSLQILSCKLVGLTSVC